jgi:hypothetical protein
MLIIFLGNTNAIFTGRHEFTLPEGQYVDIYYKNHATVSMQGEYVCFSFIMNKDTTVILTGDTTITTKFLKLNKRASFVLGQFSLNFITTQRKKLQNIFEFI